jgi:Na+/proline symporter
LRQVFVFTVYATSPKIGSPARMYELLTAAAEAAPVPGNAHGSYITMRSKNGLIFGVINIIGNFGAHLFIITLSRSPFIYFLQP